MPLGQYNLPQAFFGAFHVDFFARYSTIFVQYFFKIDILRRFVKEYVEVCEIAQKSNYKPIFICLETVFYISPPPPPPVKKVIQFTSGSQLPDTWMFYATLSLPHGDHY